MGAKDRKEIGESIRRITGMQPVVMSGKVKEVQESEGTCSVVLTMDGDEVTEGVLITAVSGNSNGVVQVPKPDSQVWVAEIDGPGKWGIVKYSDVSKVLIGSDDVEVVINGGGLGGMTKTPVLKTELDKVKNLLLHLTTIINGAPIPEPGSGAPSALQAAIKAAIAADTMPSFESIEDDKVKH